MDFGASGRIISTVSGVGTVTLSGAISNTGGNGLAKSGAGTLILSTAQTYTGVTTINDGVLRLGNATSLPGGINATGGSSGLTLNGGVVGLGQGNFLRALGTGSDQVQWTGSGGFAAYGGVRTVNLGNAAGTVTWASGSFVPNGSSLILSAADSDNTLAWANPIDFNGATRTIQVNNGSAATDATIAVALTNGGLNKSGEGTLAINSAQAYAGGTTVSAGTLTMGNASALGSTSGQLTINGGTLNMASYDLTVGNLHGNGRRDQRHLRHPHVDHRRGRCRRR
jgi:autotransporter-associated beta strand protein